MRVHASALKHGVLPEDAVQAADWPQWIEPLEEDDWPHRELRLGFDARARLLETVVLVFESGEEMVIHATPRHARQKTILGPAALISLAAKQALVPQQDSMRDGGDFRSHALLGAVGGWSTGRFHDGTEHLDQGREISRFGRLCVFVLSQSHDHPFHRVLPFGRSGRPMASVAVTDSCVDLGVTIVRYNFKIGAPSGGTNARI